MTWLITKELLLQRNGGIKGIRIYSVLNVKMIKGINQILEKFGGESGKMAADYCDWKFFAKVFRLN